MTRPTSSGPAPSPAALPARTPVLLAVGHAATAAATVVLIAQLLALPRQPLDLIFATGLFGLIVGQGVAIHRLVTRRQDLVRGHLDPARLAACAHRTNWTVFLTLSPLAFGSYALGRQPLPPPLLALLAALVLVSLLLEHGYAGWTYRQLPRWGHPVRALPAGSGADARAAQGAVLMLLVLLTAAGLALGAVIAVRAATTGLPTAAWTLGLLSATAALVLPLLFIRPALRVRNAVRYDTVHLPTLDTASRSVHRLGLLGGPAAALATATVAAAPATDLQTAGPAIPLVVIVALVPLQLSYNTRLHLADPRLRRWRSG